MKIGHRRTFHIATAFALVVIFMGAAGTASAQPPAQGPPSPSANPNSWNVNSVTSRLKEIINDK